MYELDSQKMSTTIWLTTETGFGSTWKAEYGIVKIVQRDPNNLNYNSTLFSSTLITPFMPVVNVAALIVPDVQRTSFFT
jgi:hypothetical protein